MTIREVEQQLGMTRANIRFYEKEGLLSPRRESNGYRDYSPQDVETLKKIQLLRQLHLDLDTIRALQRGERELGEAMEEQLAALASQQRVLEEARAICQAIAADGATHATLQPDRYRERIPRRESGYFAPPQDAPPAVGEPWRRFFARMLDLNLYALAGLSVELLVLHRFPSDTLLEQFFHGVAWLLLMLFLEPLLLSTWGSTPGKWIFGLVVRDRNGGKLTYGDALFRTWLVLWSGMALSVPFVTLYRLYKSWKACRAGEELPWEECSYSIRDRKRRRILLYLAAVGAYCFLLWLLPRQALLPLNRGELTPAQFAENVNDLGEKIKVLGDLRVGEDGAWYYEESPAMAGRASTVGTAQDLELPVFRYTVENGRLREVTLVWTGEERMSDLWFRERFLAAMAALLAQPEANAFRVTDREMQRIEGKLKRPAEDYDFERWGVEVSAQVESEGYEPALSGGILFREGEDGWYRLTFTIRFP